MDKKQKPKAIKTAKPPTSFPFVRKITYGTNKGFAVNSPQFRINQHKGA